MYSKQYYSDKRAKLQIQNQQIVQRLVNSAFDFVSAINDLQERGKDLDERERMTIPTSAELAKEEKEDTVSKVKGE